MGVRAMTGILTQIVTVASPAFYHWAAPLSHYTQLSLLAGLMDERITNRR